MNQYQVNPVHWRLETLLTSGAAVIHNLASRATGTITAYRLILGRCLLAFDYNEAYLEYGCCTSIGYATARLGVSKRQALEARRVADQLRPFKKLKLAAEKGKIPWSKLREIVRKATPETEEYWLALAKNFNADEIEALVGMTPAGQIPGATPPAPEYATTELRCRVGPEIFQLLRHARRTLSVKLDRAVTTAETLEWVLSAYLSKEPLDKRGLERLRRETDLDLAAEYSRTLPLVEKARELAVEMGLLQSLEEDEDEPGRVEAEQSETPNPRIALGSELLAQALGGPAPQGTLPTLVEPGRVENSETPTYAFWKNGRLCFNPKKRFATRGQRKEILRRDGYRCSTPGCPHFAWLHIHHIEPFAKGGGTTERNLLCLCSRCHKNVHDGHLVIERDTRGKLVFLDSKGRRLDRVVKLSLARWLDTWLLEDQPERYESRAVDGSWPLDHAGVVKEVGCAGDWAC